MHNWREEGRETNPNAFNPIPIAHNVGEGGKVILIFYSRTVEEINGEYCDFCLDVQESEYFGETLNGQFFSDTRAMGCFVDVVRGSVSQSIGYVSYLLLLNEKMAPCILVSPYWMLYYSSFLRRTNLKVLGTISKFLSLHLSHGKNDAGVGKICTIPIH